LSHFLSAERDADKQELEKLISYSATPTAVWRRTGEIVYANPEICALIGKQQDELLSGRTYIYQLFAKQAYGTSRHLTVREF
jgi:PAS domain-containing protein